MNISHNKAAIELLVEQAAEAAGFVPGAFQLFVDHLASMRLQPEYVTESDYLGTPFQDLIESRLYQRDGNWYSVSVYIAK